MFLIQYGAGRFVNAQSISWVDVSVKSAVLFAMTGDVGCAIRVEPDFTASFCNQLQALNDNISNIETCWNT